MKFARVNLLPENREMGVNPAKVLAFQSASTDVKAPISSKSLLLLVNKVSLHLGDTTAVLQSYFPTFIPVDVLPWHRRTWINPEQILAYQPCPLENAPGVPPDTKSIVLMEASTLFYLADSLKDLRVRLGALV